MSVSQTQSLNNYQQLSGWLVIYKIQDNVTYTDSQDGDSVHQNYGFCPPNGLPYDEQKQKFTLAPKVSVDDEALILQLVFCQLSEGESSRIEIFDNEPSARALQPETQDFYLSNEDATHSPDGSRKRIYDFVLTKKDCLLAEESDFLLFTIKVLDPKCKYRTKVVSFFVPQYLHTNQASAYTEFVGQIAFLAWVETLKISQRPMWSPEEVKSCFLCMCSFTITNRQHHCRRCGVAACNDCCKYYLRIPEYNYFKRVRNCRNCLERLYILTRNENIPTSKGNLTIKDSFTSSVQPITASDMPSYRDSSPFFRGNQHYRERTFQHSSQSADEGQEDQTNIAYQSYGNSLLVSVGDRNVLQGVTARGEANRKKFMQSLRSSTEANTYRKNSSSGRPGRQRSTGGSKRYRKSGMLNQTASSHSSGGSRSSHHRSTMPSRNRQKSESQKIELRYPRSRVFFALTDIKSNLAFSLP